MILVENRRLNSNNRRARIIVSPIVEPIGYMSENIRDRKQCSTGVLIGREKNHDRSTTNVFRRNVPYSTLSFSKVNLAICIRIVRARGIQTRKFVSTNGGRHLAPRAPNLRLVRPSRMKLPILF